MGGPDGHRQVILKKSVQERTPDPEYTLVGQDVSLYCVNSLDEREVASLTSGEFSLTEVKSDVGREKRISPCIGLNKGRD